VWKQDVHETVAAGLEALRLEQAAPGKGEEMIRVSEYFDGTMKADASGDRLYHIQLIDASDVDVGDLIYDPVMSATQIFEVQGFTADNGKVYICVLSKSKRYEAEFLTLHCSTRIAVLVQDPDFCPLCNAPFEEFLPNQVCRDWWGWKAFWARLFGRPKPGYWALICRDCKEIVGYY
jgi:hypothetical protein